MRLISIITLLALALGLQLPPITTGTSNDIVAYGPIRSDAAWLLTRERLYVTRDEGGTWTQSGPAPQGYELLAADFLDTGDGWLVAGRPAAGGGSILSLARTPDFGAEWRWTALSLSSPGEPLPMIAALQLDFATASAGVLRIRHVSSSNFERWSEWRTVDGGETWFEVGQAGVTSGESGQVAAPPGGIFLAGGTDGWKIERAGGCTGSGSRRVCKQVSKLRVTHDGARTWGDVPIPKELAAPREWRVTRTGTSAAATAGSSRTMVASGQGFDKCEIPGPYELQEWRWASPYNSVNLYIGGALRACDNRGLDAVYLADAYSMGWTFIPTWVGPQAPCTSFRSRISSDRSTAQSQGWLEANAAADALADLGLTEPSGAGSIAYYDMEAYDTSNAACNEAVQSFVIGWNQGLHARGQLAGVYGTGSTLRLLAAIAPPPDAIWAAHWIYSSYNPEASVWNVYALADDVWSNGQRLRQYTGGHWETWGAFAMNIDSNVLYGPVAVIGSVGATETLTETPTATPTMAPFTPTAWSYLPLVLQR